MGNEKASVHTVIDEFTVLKDGTITFPSNLSETDYTIQPRQLTDSDLLLDIMASKVTDNLGGFIQAWFSALNLKKINRVTIDTNFGH